MFKPKLYVLYCSPLALYGWYVCSGNRVCGSYYTVYAGRNSVLGASRVCPQISVVQASLIGELTETIVKGFAEGGAVFEGRNLEGVADHVDVFAGHENNEETDDGEDAGAIDVSA